MSTCTPTPWEEGDPDAAPMMPPGDEVAAEEDEHEEDSEEEEEDDGDEDHRAGGQPRAKRRRGGDLAKQLEEIAPADGKKGKKDKGKDKRGGRQVKHKEAGGVPIFDKVTTIDSATYKSWLSDTSDIIKVRPDRTDEEFDPDDPVEHQELRDSLFNLKFAQNHRRVAHQSTPAICDTRVTRTSQSDCLLIQIGCPCDCLAECATSMLQAQGVSLPQGQVAAPLGPQAQEAQGKAVQARPQLESALLSNLEPERVCTSLSP